jgi:hypothetical protein
MHAEMLDWDSSAMRKISEITEEAKPNLHHIQQRWRSSELTYRQEMDRILARKHVRKKDLLRLLDLRSIADRDKSTLLRIAFWRNYDIDAWL